jgi:hypothetical protein
MDKSYLLELSGGSSKLSVLKSCGCTFGIPVNGSLPNSKEPCKDNIHPYTSNLSGCTVSCLSYSGKFILSLLLAQPNLRSPMALSHLAFQIELR